MIFHHQEMLRFPMAIQELKYYGLVVSYKFLQPEGWENLKPTKSEIDKNLNRACRAYIIPKGLAKLCSRANARYVTADCSTMTSFDASRSSAEELTQALVLRMPSPCLVV
jgi:hypothetical protein